MGAEPRMGQTLASFLHASDLCGAAAYPEQELSRGESLTGPSEDHAPGQSTVELLNEVLTSCVESTMLWRAHHARWHV